MENVSDFSEFKEWAESYFNTNNVIYPSPLAAITSFVKENPQESVDFLTKLRAFQEKSNLKTSAHSPELIETFGSYSFHASEYNLINWLCLEIEKAQKPSTAKVSSQELIEVLTSISQSNTYIEFTDIFTLKGLKKEIGETNIEELSPATLYKLHSLLAYINPSFLEREALPELWQQLYNTLDGVPGPPKPDFYLAARPQGFLLERWVFKCWVSQTVNPAELQVDLEPAFNLLDYGSNDKPIINNLTLSSTWFGMPVIPTSSTNGVQISSSQDRSVSAQGTICLDFKEAHFLAEGHSKEFVPALSLFFNEYLEWPDIKDEALAKVIDYFIQNEPIHGDNLIKEIDKLLSLNMAELELATVLETIHPLCEPSEAYEYFQIMRSYVISRQEILKSDREL